MKERVVITGLGVVSAAGIGREAFFAALSTGESGVRPHPGAATDGVALSATVDDAAIRQRFDPRVLRRLARLSQMSLVAAREALAQARGDGDGEAGQSGKPVLPWAAERVGVALGTGLGTLRETMDFMNSYLGAGPESASPLLFPTSVMNAAAGQIAIELGLRGVNTTINHRDSSAGDALILAADFLLLRRADALLVGGVDELSLPMLHAYRVLSRLSSTGMRPYARGRDGTVVGEGAVVYVLERESEARARGARALCRVAGVAHGGDARSRVGWRGETSRAVEVVREALAEAGLGPESIDYVSGAGSGLLLDAVEARVVGEALGRSAPHGSVLGQTGEFLSSHAVRVAAAIYALERQALPGTVGAGEPDEEAPVPGLCREPRSASVSAVLVPTLGQGGSDSAVVLSR